MLHPLQLKEVSARYGVEIAELRDFLGKAGVPVETRGAIGNVVARVRQDGAFRRDLALHLWAIFHAPGQRVGYPNAMAMLAVAAAGPGLAVEAGDAETHELLRFVMEAGSAFDSRPAAAAAASVEPVRVESVRASPVPASPLPAVPVPVEPVRVEPLRDQARRVAPVRPAERLPELRFEPAAEEEDDRLPSFGMEEEEDGGRRLAVWAGVAVCVVLLVCFGVWLHSRPSDASPGAGQSAAPAASPNPPAGAAPNEPAVQPVKPPAKPSPSTPAAGSHRAHAAFLPPAPWRVRRGQGTSVTAAARTETGSSLAAGPAVGSTSSGASPAPAGSAAAVAAARMPAAGASQGGVYASGTAQPVTTASRSDASPAFRGTAAAPAARIVGPPRPVVRPEALGTMAANLTYGPAAQYPAAAIEQRVQGEVKLEALVDRKGNVVSTRVVSGPPELQEAAMSAVQSWQYRPYLAQGKAVAVNATVVMDFQLR